MTLREKIMEYFLQYPSFSGSRAKKYTDAILSLFRQAVEEAKPKEKERIPMEINGKKTMILSTHNLGYNQALSDYDDAIMEVLK